VLSTFSYSPASAAGDGHGAPLYDGPIAAAHS